VTFEEWTGPFLVNRIARQRQVLLTANVRPGYSSQAVIDAITGKAKELQMPDGRFVRADGPLAPLSIVVLNQSINIFSSLGILVLFGILKKNGILQIDNMIQLRNQGVEREEAIRRANRDRLRPILMTTLAFVAGMLPLFVSYGVGSGTNRAIASVIIGGQTLALVLTLVGTPVGP
jgi:HAE1 family hydrophobic/amphiphilic exporter-1